MKKLLSIIICFISLAFLMNCSGNSSKQQGKDVRDKKLYTMDTVGAGGRALHLETQNVDNGYGYIIAVDGKKMISQKVIPVVEGTHFFATEDDAFAIGTLAIRKMASGMQFPTIILEDLIDCHIIEPDGKLNHANNDTVIIPIEEFLKSRTP